MYAIMLLYIVCTLHTWECVTLQFYHCKNSLYDWHKKKSKNVKFFLNRVVHKPLYTLSALLFWNKILSNIPTKMIEKSNRMEFVYFWNVATTMNLIDKCNEQEKTQESHWLDRVKMSRFIVSWLWIIESKETCDNLNKKRLSSYKFWLFFFR